MARFGNFEVYSVQTGSLRLDGGAMFGVVPKVLWSKSTDPDEQNRIPLATRTLIAIDRNKCRVFLTDTGCGTKWIAKEIERFAIRYDPHAIERAMQVLGLSTKDVTDVVITHLHFDHNGGLADWFDEPGGKTVLRYPNARHWIHRYHWEHALRPHVKDRASFLPEDFAALRDADVVTFVEEEYPLSPCEGVAWQVTHGHTPYHLHPIFGEGTQRIMFVGDMIPTCAHLRPAWVMAYDVQPTRTIDEKSAVLARAIKEKWVLAFAHDPTHAAVELDGQVDRPIVARTFSLEPHVPTTEPE